MYRIVKRIVHTVTTVTWVLRLRVDSADGESLEKQITLPPSYSFLEEEIPAHSAAPDETDPSSIIGLDEGEKS